MRLRAINDEQLDSFKQVDRSGCGDAENPFSDYDFNRLSNANEKKRNQHDDEEIYSFDIYRFISYFSKWKNKKTHQKPNRQA